MLDTAESKINNMAQIQTFQDGTSMGTFSQIKLDDGNKILISLTQTEIAILKVGFLGIPKETLWKEDIYKFLDFIYPQGHTSKEANKSVLEISVELAVRCNSLEEVREKFEGLKKLDKARELLGALSEKTEELQSWEKTLKGVTELLVDSFNARYKTATNMSQDLLENKQSKMDNDQEKELMILSLMEIIWSVYAVFTEAEAKDIIDDFRTVILDKYFSDLNEKKEFEKRFWERWDEYAEVLDPKNENLILQIGGIFCDHFFGTRVSKVNIMGLVGMNFLSYAKEIKKSLEKIKSGTRL